ncbi:MAG: VIT domain-containing protein [Planctomycetota bacterium]|jgi:Ca-activated chloride channel family protein
MRPARIGTKSGEAMSFTGSLLRAPALLSLLLLALLVFCATEPERANQVVDRDSVLTSRPPEPERSDQGEDRESPWDPQLGAGDDWTVWWALNKDDILNVKASVKALERKVTTRGGAHFHGKGFSGARAEPGHLLVIEKAKDDGEPPVFRGRPVTQGMLIAEDEAGREIGLFPLRRTDVKARISGFLASVDVTQRYRNRFERSVEAVYVFPLPRRAAVSDFLMIIGDRTIQGVVRERGEARRIYEQARRDGLTTSLLTQERPNVFTQRVANLEAGRPVDVTITYFHPLRPVDGGLEFVFPMVVAHRYMPGGSTSQEGEPSAARVNPPTLPPEWRPGHDISVAVEVDAGMGIETLESPTHAIAVERSSPSRAEVALETGPVVPNKDFVLRIRTCGDAHRLGLLAHRGDAGGFFAMLLAPKAEADSDEVVPREFVFLLDCSGSMSGDPIAKVKAVLHRFLGGVRERDTFRMVRFSSSASALSDVALPATPENVARARAWVDALVGCGGTEMLTGIRAALAAPVEEGRLRHLCLLTDGLIGNEREILAEVRNAGANQRVFSFGVFSFTLEKVAEVGRGAAQIVLPETPADAAAEEFFGRLESPCLTGLEIDFGGIPVEGVRPERLPDAFAGRPLVVLGRYSGGGDAVITVRGRAAGRPFVKELPASFPDWEERHAALAQVWARREIEDLMHRDLGRVTERTRKLVTDLGIDFRLVTPFTSFLAVDSSHAADGPCVTVHVPVALPDGVDCRGVYGDRGDVFELHPLGVSMAAEEGGLRITRVRRGSPADAAGLRSGDLVRAMNGDRVADGGEAEGAARAAEERFTLDVARGGNQLRVEFGVAGR